MRIPQPQHRAGGPGFSAVIGRSVVRARPLCIALEGEKSVKVIKSKAKRFYGALFRFKSLYNKGYVRESLINIS